MKRVTSLALLFLLSSIIFFTFQCTQKASLKAKQIEEKRVSDSLATLDSIANYEAHAPRYKYSELQAGEGVFQVMGRMGIVNPIALKVINKLRFEVELVSLRAGEKFYAKFNADTTKLLEFGYTPYKIITHKIMIDTNTNELSYQKSEKPTVIKHRLVKGTLKEGSTLNQSLLDAGFSHAITQVVNGILLCRISFRTDARVNDSFSVLLLEESFNDSVVPRRTKVLYTSYNGVRSGFHEAYRYDDGDAKSTYTAHYTPDGQALIHSGLRYPVDRLHISSSYGWRIHPVTGRRRMHNGVDYSGRVGTPIYSVAQGKVVVSGYDKLSGNKVAIRHADKSTSYYLHLSRKLVSVGQNVRSRQLIGKMGRTGRVTGSHLHFGFKKPNGRWMNPLAKRMIATPKLKDKRLEKLREQVKLIDEILNQLESSNSVVFSLNEVPQKNI